jgi:hypothetical protein
VSTTGFGSTVLQGSIGDVLAGLGILLFVFFLVFALVPLIGLWKVFEKAGEPGWAAIVPIYNIYLMVKISGNSPLFVLLLLIPLVNLLVGIKVMIDLADKFGKGVGYALGMMFLPFVFFPMLGFGSARYRGSAQGRRGGRAPA